MKVSETNKLHILDPKDNDLTFNLAKARLENLGFKLECEDFSYYYERCIINPNNSSYERIRIYLCNDRIDFNSKNFWMINDSWDWDWDSVTHYKWEQINDLMNKIIKLVEESIN